MVGRELKMIELKRKLQNQDTQEKTNDRATVQNLEQARSAMLNLQEDIDEEKQRSQEAAQDLKKFQLAVEYAADHIIITDPDGIVLYANPAATAITGFDKADILGRKAGSKQLWGGQMEQGFYQNLWETIKTKQRTFVGEVINRRKSGEIYTAKVTISPVLDEHHRVRYFVGIERDITKEKQIDEMKSQFVSYASHQLRTPLGSIRWNMEMLLGGDYGQLPAPAHEALEQNYANTLRLIKLVNDLLNVSRIEEGRVKENPQPTDLVQVIRTVIKELTPEAGEHQIKIAFQEKTDNLPNVTLDSDRFHEVIENLVSNGIKYSQPNDQVDVLITRMNQKIEIKVKDVGIGIPKADQARIYDKFFRAENAAKTDTEGTGLGLFVTKAYVEAWGGAITFESQEGVGTTFTVTLPLEPKRGELSRHLNQGNQVNR
jgi:PAS domain S-box-containing protein